MKACTWSVVFYRTAIRLGALDVEEAVQDGSQPQDIAVDSIIWHEQYNHLLKTNNIAIVKMKTEVTFTSKWNLQD